MALHTYKICEVLPRDPAQRMGRPRRDIKICWDDLSESELALLRSVQEPRLKVGQIAEVDGKIVARGPEGDAGPATNDADNVEDGDDAEDGDAADDTGDADVPSAAGPALHDPVGVAKHATDMLWDAFQRHADNSAVLRDQTNELNRRALAQAKLLDDALATLQARLLAPPAPPAPPPPPSPPISVSLDDLYNVLRVGASIVRDVVGATDKADKEPPKP
jgi:hypothetical protein